MLLSDRDREKLVRCLRLLSSNHPGERDAAGLAANRIVAGHNMDWGDVVASKPPVVVRPEPPPQARGWRADVQTCRGQESRLTEWEQGFLSSLSLRGKPPTPKQLNILAGIVAKVRR